MKDGSGVLCFSLGSRLRGNDGGLAREGRRGQRRNDGGLAGEGRALFTLTLTLSHQGRGDLPGPACAGMTGGQRGKDGLFTLTLGPPLNLPLGGGGRWLEGEGI